MVNRDDLEGPVPPNLTRENFGVRSDTGTGDGRFEVYRVNNCMFMLVGGETMFALEESPECIEVRGVGRDRTPSLHKKGISDEYHLDCAPCDLPPKPR